MSKLISINGTISSLDKASIPATDRGFLFADNIFETIVVFDGKILNLKKHLERLRISAENMRIDIPWTDEELSFELVSIAEQNKLPKGVIRLVVTRGCGFGISFDDHITPNKYIYSLPANVDPTWVQEKGIALKKKKSTGTKRGPSSKTGNYLSSIVEVNKAKSDGFQDILWVNSESEVTEASTANIFFIGRYGDEVEIVTPSLYSGLLSGITRATIMELLARAKIRVEERVVYSEEIPRFDEAFVCSTVRGLVPVNKISEHTLHTTRATSVFLHIKRLHDTWAECELGHRIDWNTGKPV